MKIIVADVLLKELERIAVDTVFGIISIHNIPFTTRWSAMADSAS